MATHSRIFSRKARIAWSNTAKSLLTFGNLRKQNFLGWRVTHWQRLCVVQQADSARFARRPRLSIMKLHRIKQTRGSAPPLSLSLSLCLYHFMSSLLLDRVCVGQTCTGAPIDFPIIGWQRGEGGGRGGGERGTQTRAYTRIHAKPLSLSHPAT